MEDAAARRSAMVDRLRRSRVVQTEPVERALRAVPRHTFLPQMPLKVAYADHAVPVKHGGGGAAISSASQPTMVASMLEDLEVAQGHRVLEVGTGTGYNAALLSVLVGATGRVVSVELEDDLARQRRAAPGRGGRRRASRWSAAMGPSATHPGRRTTG